MVRFSLKKQFPLLTTKKIHLKSIIIELLWFLRGDTNIQYLNENQVSIWDEWADENGELGPIYGKQWRSWSTADGRVIDQIENVVHEIKHNQYSRRLIVSAWNVGDINQMALPPCHVMFQFYVSEKRLSCLLYQRSADIFLGLPFNIASYALLTIMMAHVCDLEPFELIHIIGDAHLYKNHLDQARIQLQRKPLPLPTISLKRNIDSLTDFQYEDFILNNYQAHPHIRASVAV